MEEPFPGVLNARNSSHCQLLIASILRLPTQQRKRCGYKLSSLRSSVSISLLPHCFLTISPWLHSLRNIRTMQGPNILTFTFISYVGSSKMEKYSWFIALLRKWWPMHSPRCYLWQKLNTSPTSLVSLRIEEECWKVNPQDNTNETALIWLRTARRVVCFFCSTFPL